LDLFAILTLHHELEVAFVAYTGYVRI